MKKKNGFTLVELLAVIIVLALIMVIAIPSLLSTTNSAKKENFYLYAQNLSSKAQTAFIQQNTADKDSTTCKVYDISKDLGLPNTGDYEGWVKVSKKPAEEGYKRAKIDFDSSGRPIKEVYYCITTEGSCRPNDAVRIKDGITKTSVEQKIKQGETLCASYYVVIGKNKDGKDKLGEGGNSCRSFNSLNESTFPIISDTYKYEVEVTLTDRNYKVQSYKMLNMERLENEDNEINLFKKKFFEAIDSHKNEVGTTFATSDVNQVTTKISEFEPYRIVSPQCTESDPIIVKGLNNRKTEIITTTTTKPKTCKYTEEEVEENHNKYWIYFNTYGGLKTDGKKYTPLEHCSTCAGDSEIQNPVRPGYTFDGWYYDSAYTEKVSGYYIRNIKKVKKFDSSGNCLEGYEDIQLYAKWNSDATTTTTRGTTIVEPNETTSRDITEITEQTTTSRDVTEPTTTTTIFDKTDYSLILESLSVAGYDIGFDPFTLYYDLNVPNTQESVSVSYIAYDPESVEVNVEGTDNLKVGINNVAVRVFNIYTNKTLVYKIRVKKFDIGEEFVPSEPGGYNWDPDSGLPDPTLDESNAQLSTLIVSGYVLPFKSDVYEYDLETRGEEKLTVTYHSKSKRAIVMASGYDNVRDGSKIIVKVQSQNGYYHKTYTINIKVRKQESTETKVLRYVAIGLGCAAAVMGIVIAADKNGGLKFLSKKPKDKDKPKTDDIVSE